ncbi:MAG: NAD(P)H-dependent flavin oxidoreductase [Burkholderiales bacterium]
MKTPLCQQLGIELPIIQAPMAGGVTTPELVAKVSAAGALGSFGFAYTQPETMQRDVELVRAKTDKPICVNLFASKNVGPIPDGEQRSALEAVAPYFQELGLKAPRPVRGPYAPDQAAQLDAVAAMRPAVFTFHLGEVAAQRIGAFRAQGIRVGGCATCIAEAKHLEEIGVDFIIAQGAEAGGHRGTYLRDPYDAMTGTFALTRLLVRAVRVPVVAAGGIMDGAGIAAVLALGAQAAQLGTAFVTCTESGASPAHKAAILAAEEDSTLITEKFSGKPARGIVNRYMREMKDAPNLAFPAQNAVTGPLRAAAAKAGKAEYLSLWAGQAVPLARDLGAAELVATLRDETRHALERLAQLRA